VRPVRSANRCPSLRDEAEEAASTGSAAGRPSTPVVDLLPYVPLALALAVFAIWGARDGGYAPIHWLPGTLFVVGLTAVVGLTGRRPFSGRRDVIAAAALLGGYTLWSFLSITWADVKGDAWDGANRTLLYLCTFVLFAWTPISSRVAAVLIGSFAALTAIIGGVEFLRVLGAASPEHSFISGRLSTPISYPNATAAFLLAPFIPAVFLASRRGVPVIFRAALLAASGLLLELATMCQSRASLVALPAVLVGFLAVSTGRVRSLLAFSLVAAPAALGAHTLLNVYPAVLNGEDVHGALSSARGVLAWSALALFVAGGAVATLDRVFAMPPRVTTAIGWSVSALAAVAVISGSTYLVSRYGDPAARASAAWREFKTERSTPTENHLVSGLSGPRYDVWRVALDEFKQSPITGVGTENFAVDYLRRGRTRLEPMHPHSLELRVLAQTGLVGVALFGGFIVLAGIAAARSLHVRSGFAGLGAACLAASTYWLVHGSVDWFWEFPALGAPAFAWLGIATQLAPHGSPTTWRPPRFYTMLFVATTVVAASSLVLPWLAVNEINRAADHWPTDPAAAFARLERARQFNPLTDRADLIAGVIASRVHDARRERTAFERVLDRNPYNWYAQLELAILDAREGRRAAALSALRDARRLDPREPLIPYVRGKIEHGRPVSQAQIDALLRERTAILTGAHQR
jgi:O-Antigen ligase